MQTTTPRILVVDDDPFIIELLRDFLQAAGFQLTLMENPVEALELTRRERFDVVLLDIMMPRLDGLSFLEAVKQVPDTPEVIMITARAEADLVARAMKAGAFDYIVKPISIQRLIMATKNALARRALNTASGTAGRTISTGTLEKGYLIAGNASGLLLERAYQQANYFAFVLVTGPEGSGKSRWVQLLHDLSDRADGPLEMMGCDLIPRVEVARELFGHMTGAGSSLTYQPGWLKRADGGVLCLRNLETLPEFVQAHLSEYMDSGLLSIPGLPEEEYLDVKIVATTRLDLSSPPTRARFSPNFLRRLSLITIPIPGLGERKDEIVPFARHFLEQHAREAGRPARRLDPVVEEILKIYPWERNLIELREAIAHSAEHCVGDTIMVRDLPPQIRSRQTDLSYQLAQDVADRLE